MTPKTVKKKMKTGNLGEVEKNKKQKEGSRGIVEDGHNIKIKSYHHNSLNTSKDIVRSLEVSLCTMDKMKPRPQNKCVVDQS